MPLKRQTVNQILANLRKGVIELGKGARPLSNMYVTMLQHPGIESDTFGSSDGSLNELLLQGSLQYRVPNQGRS